MVFWVLQFNNYVSSTLFGMALTKSFLVSAIPNKDLKQDHTKRLCVPIEILKNKNLEDFVTAKSMIHFSMKELAIAFLNPNTEL